MDRTDRAGAVADDAGTATGVFNQGIERAVDEVLAAYDARRLRLWVANFADLRDEIEDFREWGGLVRITAEGFLGHWHPDRTRLLDRVAARHDGGAGGFDAAAEELMPLAREDLARELTAKHVPPKLAERAKSFILPAPPVQQWKM